MCNNSNGYAPAEAACNISVIMAEDINTSLCVWAATPHLWTSSNMQANRTHNPYTAGCRRYGKGVSWLYKLCTLVLFQTQKHSPAKINLFSDVGLPSEDHQSLKFGRHSPNCAQIMPPVSLLRTLSAKEDPQIPKSNEQAGSSIKSCLCHEHYQQM